MIGRPFLARSQTTDKNDASGFFVRYAGASGGILLDMSVHDIDTVRWLLGANGAKRVFATGTIAVHAGLREANDVDNAVATIEFDRRRDRDDLRVADDGPRPRNADRDRRHRRQAHRRAESAPESRRDRRRARRAQRVHADVLRALRRGVPQRGAGIRRRRPRGQGPAADAARRDRSDAHRHRGDRVAAHEAVGGAPAGRTPGSRRF